MDRIDRILLAERELNPGANFRARVMEEVRLESEAPPIPFPWRPFLWGFVGLPTALLAVLWWFEPALALPEGGTLERLLELSVHPALALASTALLATWLLAFCSYRLLVED